MLHEISAARDEHRSGALDVEWDGARASLFFVFGQPSHATFESFDGRDLAGAGALSALVEELPLDFRVVPWRRIMVTEDTLRCTVNDLFALFGGDADEPIIVTAPAGNGHSTNGGAPAPALASAPAPPPPPVAPAPVVPFGIRDFPLLPLGPSLWFDAAANVVHLEVLVSRLPNSLIVLTGPTRRAAALVADGSIVDAVWVDGEAGLLGEDAAHALMSVGDGRVSGYRIDDLRLVAAIPMLWRGERLSGALPARWLDAEDTVAEVRGSGRSCALLVDGEEPGAALFHDGELVAVYTAQRRRPASTTTALRSLLHSPGARVTVVGCTDVAEGTELNDESFHLFIAREDTSTAAVTPAAEDPSTAPAPEAMATPHGDQPAVDVAVPPGDEPAVAVAEPHGDEPDEAVGAPHRDELPLFALSGAVDEPHAAVAAVEPGVELPAPAPDVASPVVDMFTLEPASLAGEAEPSVAEFETAEATPAPAAAAPAPAPVSPETVDTADLPVLIGDEPSWTDDAASAPTTQVDATHLQPIEFVPARLDIDIDALRTELSDIAAVWLGADDATPVAASIAAARPGVDDFVSAIAAIASMNIPGHEHAVVRAMAREMHFRAAEVLCGV